MKKGLRELKELKGLRDKAGMKSSSVLRTLFAAGFALLLLCLPGCRAVDTGPEQAMAEYASSYTRAAAGSYLECVHYDERGFQKAVRDAAPYSIDGDMFAAVSPHFLPVMSFTANILCTLAQAGTPDPTVFVLAPDHSGEGLPLILADRGWSTPFGALELDEEATAAIRNSPSLADKIDIDLYHLQNDHSAATLMPFIKYYLPDAKIVTILLNGDCQLQQLEALAEIIYETGRTKPVFALASVDFSHYLYIGETAQRDEVRRPDTRGQYTGHQET